MHNRRRFIQGGLGAVGLGVLRGAGFGMGTGNCVPSGGLPLLSTAPFTEALPGSESIRIGGMPFAPAFSGDAFPSNDEIPFHFGTGDCPSLGEPPASQEGVEVAVIGGGLSGLTAAYLLREHRPVLFELHERFGGAAQGEVWEGTRFSLGNAYVITPDSGTFLDAFYRELGLDRVVRVDEDDPEIELGGKLLGDFFDPETRPAHEVEAFRRYKRLVRKMAEMDYPELPLPEGVDNGWILALDRLTLREHIEQQIDMPVPPDLAAAIQAYCYSSFAAGWEEISAASGWNFLAAEEFGRWVFPGGNAYMAEALWKRLARLERDTPAGCEPRYLRAGCQVTDVRLDGDRVRVTWRDSHGVCRSLRARRVVMTCPKLVAKRMIHDPFSLDPRKADAMFNVDYRAYVVANVLLDAPVEHEFYDTFLLGNGAYPMNQVQVEQRSRVTDMLNGAYARRADLPRSVLTLYWPLPWDDARWSILIENGFQDYTESIVPQIRAMLDLLDVKPSAVKQVRMTRWGHALPLSAPGFIADGRPQDLLRPIDDKIFFAHQDDWALPAVENSLLDAKAAADLVQASL